jgi:hypothetical protein
MAYTTSGPMLATTNRPARGKNANPRQSESGRWRTIPPDTWQFAVPVCASKATAAIGRRMVQDSQRQARLALRHEAKPMAIHPLRCCPVKRTEKHLRYCI